MKLRQDMRPVFGRYLAVGQLGDDPGVGAGDADGVLAIPCGPVGPSSPEPPTEQGAGDGVVDVGELLGHGADPTTVDPDEAMESARRSCASKRSYPTLIAAGKAAASAYAKRGHKLRVYPCQFCNGFHLTSQTLEHFARRAPEVK